MGSIPTEGSDGDVRHGTPTGSCDQAQTLVCVGSNPSRATPATPGLLPSDARWTAKLPVKQPPVMGNVGSIPTRGTDAIVDFRFVTDD